MLSTGKDPESILRDVIHLLPQGFACKTLRAKGGPKKKIPLELVPCQEQECPVSRANGMTDQQGLAQNLLVKAFMGGKSRNLDSGPKRLHLLMEGMIMTTKRNPRMLVTKWSKLLPLSSCQLMAENGGQSGRKDGGHVAQFASVHPLKWVTVRISKIKQLHSCVGVVNNCSKKCVRISMAFDTS